MPDASSITPIQPPNLNSLSSMVNLGNQALDMQYKQGTMQSRIAQQAAQSSQAQSQAGLTGIDLERAQQANNERIDLQGFMSNPDNWQTNGKIDMDKLNSAVPKIAPYTGAEVLTKLGTLSTNETTAASAKQNLTQTQRALVSNPMAVLGRAGVQDPKAYISALQDVINQNPDNKDIANLAKAHQSTISVLPPGADLAKGAITASQSLMSPTEQQSALSPTVATVGLGGKVQPVVNQPSVGGNAPSITPGGGPAMPTTLGPQAITDTAGNLHVIGGGGGNTGGLPQGGGASSQNSNGWINASNASVLTDAQKQVTAIRNAGQNTLIQRNLNDNILKLSSDTKTGYGTASWQNLMGAIGATSGASPTKDYEKLNKFLAQKQAQAMETMGIGSTDSRQALLATANGSTHISKDALQEVTKYTDALNTGLMYFQRGVNAAVGTGAKQDFSKFPQFQADWAANADPSVFRLMDAARRGDQTEIDQYSQMPGVTEKLINLKNLSRTGRLPQ